MTDPINREAFAKLADWYAKYPESWDQYTWGSADLPDEDAPIDDPEFLVTECGSHACLAGTAAMLHGYLPERIGTRVSWTDVHLPGVSRLRAVDYVAREILFNEDDYGWMFGSDCQPLGGLTVAEAMRAIADGANPVDVWG